MANVVLVNPAIAYSRWSAPFQPPSPDTLFIRLGLAYLGAALEAKGHSVSLLDLRTLSGWAEFEQELVARAPDFVGISIHSVELSTAHEAALRARRVVPQAKLVAGGPHPTVFPDELDDFDFIVRGEGEASFPQLVADPSRFEPIFWGETPDLNAIPFPNRELWPDFRARIHQEPFGIRAYRFPLPMAEVINNRGCPYRCTFCFGPGERNMYTRINTRGERVPYIRGRSVENVIAELEMLRDTYGVRSVMFHDDHFMMKRTWIEQFCESLHERGFVGSGFKWVTSAKADTICRHQSLLKTMADAGLELLIVGFESFSPKILKWFNKSATREQNFEAAEICKRAGVKVWANYILGVPTDNGWHPEDDMLTVAGAHQVEPVHYSPAFFTPVPGSELYAFYKDNDLIIGDGSAEEQSNRGAMTAKLKGVDYEFLQKIMFTDQDLT